MRRTYKVAVAALTGTVTAGAALTGAPSASADAGSYAHSGRARQAACTVLDVYPTYGGVEGVLHGIQDYGFSPYTSGLILGTIVREACPRHLELVQFWAADHGYNP